MARSYAAIFRTSGTTGASKRMPVTHRNLIEMARDGTLDGMSPSDRAACIMPIHYNAGFKATLLAPLLIGCSVAFSKSGRPKEFVKDLDLLRPTWLTAAPAWLQSLVDVVKQSRASPSIPCASSCRPLPTCRPRPETPCAACSAFPSVEYYGLCEAGMMTRPSLGTAHPSGSGGRGARG